MKKTVQTTLLAAVLIVSAAGSALAQPGIPAVPEPGTLVLFGLGAAGFVLYKKFKK